MNHIQAPITKHQLPSNDQMTNVRTLVIETCGLVITSEGGLYGSKKGGK